MYTTIAQTLKYSRDQVHDIVKNLSAEQWMMIPAGHDNNIAWNVGHLIWAQAGLCYGRTDLEMPIERPPYTKLYGIGTSPAEWESDPDPNELLSTFMWQAEKNIADAESGLFDNADYTPWSLGTGFHLPTLQAVQIYNLAHEGEHRGMIMALRNLV